MLIQVEQFEQDFANGYLFGELLFKFNQQSNFHEFSKKENTAAKIENFSKLQPILRNLKVKFDSQTIDSIMKEERGAALRLLYQLKMSLERVYPPTDVNVLKKTGKIGDNRPAMKIPAPKEKYEAQATTFFHQRLQVLNKPQKQIIMERHLKKFDDELVRQDQLAKNGDQAEKDARERRLLDMRAAGINKVQRNAGFMEEWLQKGVQDWQKNQHIKKDRERRDLEFEYKETEKYHQLALTKIDQASKELNDGIDKFERSLKTNYGISTKVKKQDAERAVSESINNGQSPMRQTNKSQRFSSVSSKGLAAIKNPFAQSIRAAGTQIGGLGQAMTLTSTGLRSKDKKVISEANRKERERRRRKLIVDQMKTYQDMEQTRRQDQVLERLRWQAKQEEELVYEKWRTEQCKQVIVDNRKLREARYDKRREIDTQTAEWREEELLKQLKGQMEREIDTFKDRDVEMRICEKQAHRERRNEFGAVLFDAIFEIANEAYIHQQEADSNDIDSRNWHEWLQLFVEEMPIEGTLSRLGDSNATTTIVAQQSAADPHEKLDQMELVDYLKNQGQWTKDLILENPPNLEQFLTGQTDSQPAAAAAKGGKGAPAKAAAEAVTLEDGDADLPSEAPNNFQLGDAIEQIVNLNYEARARQMRPKMPQNLALKVAFIGYSFAGKKTQSALLAELYGLQTYKLNDIVDEALSYYEAHPDPISIGDKTIEQEAQQEGKLSDNSELEDQEYNAEEDFRLCGERIASLLRDGQEISDEVYVSLYVSKLRLTYPHKSKRELRRELTVKVEKQRDIAQKIEALEKELDALLNPSSSLSSEEGASTKQARKKISKDPAFYQGKIDELKKEHDKLDEVQRNGWILVDFPTTFAQAKLLETALSGFVPSQEQELIDREKEIGDAYLLVQPTAKEQPPKCLIKSGLDAVIWFDLSREECMRRAIGRRFDSEDQRVYHIEDIPPQTDMAPLCERLVPMSEDFNTEATLIDRWISFDQGRKALENWLLQFGDSNLNQTILYKIEAHSSHDEVKTVITQIFEGVLKTKQDRESQVKAKINAALDAREQAEIQRLQKEKEEEEKKKREDELGEASQDPSIKKEEGTKVERPEPATERVAAKEPAVSNIDNDFKPTVLKVWQELSKNYKLQMKNVFRQVRVQRERVTSTFSHTQSKYLEYIHRPDAKQEKLEQFIKDFNDFSDQFPDLREDESTKDELHQRVDTLSDELWEMIEERKEQHTEERKKIMESGWVEHELTFMVSSAQSLMQAEVDKFKSSIQIIQDYYHAFEDKLIPEAPALVTQDLVAEGEELPPVETLAEGLDSNVAGSYSYPRLDKIFEKALKTQFIADVSSGSAAAQDKKGGAPAKGKDPKKPADDEKPSEESQYVKEMKAAIKVEKSILRYRLTQIRNWALKRLRDVRSKAIRVYTKLEDWIHVANKAENDSVDEMCIVLKDSIEEEKKIQDELRIKFMDFCVDEKIMNFIEPQPDKLPAMEQVRNDRFSIQQLSTLITELEELAKEFGDGAGGVPNKLVTDLFIRKLENSKSLWDNGSIPEEWWNLREYDFQNIVRNLDRTNHGSIDWRQLGTFLILLRSPLPTDQDLENLKKTSSSDLIDREHFKQIKAWFDQSEYSQDRDYSIAFPRLKSIKDLLFTVNREHALPHSQQSEERISLESLFKVVKSAKQVVQGNIVKKSDKSLLLSVKTFGDVLFMTSNLPLSTPQPKKKQ